MLIKKYQSLREAQVTDYPLYKRRRQFIQAGLALTGAALLPAVAEAKKGSPLTGKLPGVSRNDKYQLEDPNSWEEITTYNNFYEFGTGKHDPAKRAHTLRPGPWSVTVDGEVNKPGVYQMEDIMKWNPLEERIYRFRCVEAWSMVVPWVGFSLAEMLKRFEPNSNAKYVEFTTLHDKAQMPGQRRSVLDWPYVEGLRIDEAMHPLSMMVVGLYGRVLPNQNGAPLRLMVPWKYGFKNIKSIVRIRFTDKQPRNTWAVMAPREYGFYANVNPTVDHPRWSQARERRIGQGSLFSSKQKTLMYNGYGDEVAHLYAGMNLRKHF